MNFIIPVYNEEKNIVKCFSSIITSLSDAGIKRWKLYFILYQGSTDGSISIIKGIKRSHRKNVNVISVTSPGKTVAQKAGISLIKNRGIIAFLDCDTYLDDGAMRYVIKEFKGKRNPIVIGGLPIPVKPEVKTAYLNMTYNVLNFASAYPDALKPKISLHNQARNYFNGRFFVLKSKKYWLLKDERFPDDILLIDQIYDKYGVNNTFRLAEEAKCYYKPYMNFRSHYLSHLKNYFFLKDLYSAHPEFKKYNDLYTSEIDWKYIKSLSVGLKAAFIFWLAINQFEGLLYRLEYGIYHQNADGRELWSKIKKM